MLRLGHSNDTPVQENEAPLTRVIREQMQLLASSLIAEMKNECKKALANPKTAGEAAKALGMLTAFTPIVTQYLKKMPDNDAQRIYDNAKIFIGSVDERLKNESNPDS